MGKKIRVWDGSTWQSVAVAFPYEYITINGTQVNLGGSVTISNNDHELLNIIGAI